MLVLCRVKSASFRGLAREAVAIVAPAYPMILRRWERVITGRRKRRLPWSGLSCARDVDLVGE
jgi:hypothetical protein